MDTLSFKGIPTVTGELTRLTLALAEWRKLYREHLEATRPCESHTERYHRSSLYQISFRKHVDAIAHTRAALLAKGYK